MMTRRDLLRYLLTTPLAATFDVERLLWTPRPTVVVPDMRFIRPWISADGRTGDPIAFKELQALIKKMMDAKLQEGPWTIPVDKETLERMARL